MHGQNVRPEKEQKEAEYRESWPCFARTLRDRSVFFDKQSHGVLFYTGCTKSIPILNNSNHHLTPRCAGTLKLMNFLMNYPMVRHYIYKPARHPL